MMDRVQDFCDSVIGEWSSRSKIGRALSDHPESTAISRPYNPNTSLRTLRSHHPPFPAFPRPELPNRFSLNPKSVDPGNGSQHHNSGQFSSEHLAMIIFLWCVIEGVPRHVTPPSNVLVEIVGFLYSLLILPDSKSQRE